MTLLAFKGFAGVRLEAETLGLQDDPAVLLLHGLGQSRAVMAEAGQDLAQAGRYVINLDLRGHGGSERPGDARYDLQAYVEDVRAVLAQLGTRPVVIATADAGSIAAVALEQDAVTLAAGLVLMDMPGMANPGTSSTSDDSGCDNRALDQFQAAAWAEQMKDLPGKIGIPVQIIVSSAFAQEAQRFAAGFGDAELVETEETDQTQSRGRAELLNGLILDFLERRQPLSPPEYRTGSDARTLRDALGCFATGVTIVTAIDGDGQPVGLTANSFTSVSLDPPLLLVCIANTSGSAATMRTASHFAVNVLQIGQQPTSNRFAGKKEDRFASTPWSPGETGAPVLTGSLSSFECAHEALHEAGDHFILIGRVLKASFEPRRDPLLYFRGKYRRLHFA